MKAAIYTICKNESHNVKAFIDHTFDTDYSSGDEIHTVILDTGSADNTMNELNSYRGNLDWRTGKRFLKYDQSIIIPWRFDEARNKALKLVPKDVDVCISIDMDERIEKDWFTRLKRQVTGNLGNYQYIATWKDKLHTIPEIIGPRTKIHTRNDFHWERAVHEVLTPNENIEVKMFNTDIRVGHHQNNEQRNYEPILTDILSNNPNDLDALLQRASEYMTKKQWENAIKDYKKYIKLCFDTDEEILKFRKAICWLSIAEAYFNINKINDCLQSYYFAIAEYPEYRESWMYLAFLTNQIGKSELAYGAISEGLKIVNNKSFVVKDLKCWGDEMYQLKERIKTNVC